MFINVAPDTLRKGFFQAEVSDLNGRFHLLSGIWGRDIVAAHVAFEKIATSWDSFDAPSDEVMAAQTAAIVEDCARWGCE